MLLYQKLRDGATVLLILLLLVTVRRSAARGPCDPLVPEYCQLPFPNSFFTAPSSRTPTGVQVNFSTHTFPVDVFGRLANPGEWNTLDGFSPFPSILAYFPNISDANLPPHWDIQQSLEDDCPTVLLDVEKGEKLPHFAELDTALNLPQRALMIWPTQRLRDNSQYVVALRQLRNDQTELVKPSEAFVALSFQPHFWQCRGRYALHQQKGWYREGSPFQMTAHRDNVTSSDPDVEYRRKEYGVLFEKLESVGVQRESLQLAWDFTTASLESLTKRLLFVRDDAFQRVGKLGPKFSINTVEDNYSEHIYRHLQGTMSIPLYLTSPLPGAHLVIDKTSGLPIYQGDAEAQFTVLVPRSVANGTHSPARVLQYGHGLFGSQTEVESGYLQSQADEYGYVLAACDWWGMAEYDEPAVADMIATDIGDFGMIPERLTQGMLNALLLMRLLKGGLASDPHLVFQGKEVINPELASYYGNSQGGVMGEVYMAATTEVTRGVLGVAGGPYGILLPRSSDFTPFEVILRALYPDPVNYISTIALANMIWSRLEPNAYMSSITHNPLPGTPTHRVLYHYALGDAQVNLLGLYSVARSSGAVMYESNVRGQFLLPNGQKVTEKLFGFNLVPDNSTVTQGAVAMGFQCGAPPEPSGNTPPDSNYDTHERPRRSKLAQEQMAQFLKTGEIRNVCGGTCQC